MNIKLNILWFLFIIIFLSGNSQSATLDELKQYISQRLQPQNLAESKQHCGFSIQFELQQHLQELEPQWQSLAKVLLTEPQRQKSVLSPAGFFILHYDTSGSHAVPLTDQSQNGTPDYVDSAAVYFDKAWQTEIIEMGFTAPPDSDGQPRKPYPIYFSNMGFYGQTSFNTDDDIVSLDGFNYPSYIEIHSNFFSSGFYTSGYAAMKVTAAHEFNHAIQLGYNFRSSDIYFMEMTSTWMEEFVYDDVNDYLQYLPRYFNNIFSKRFDAWDGNSEYAAGLYLHMLQEEFGWQAIPQIWENTRKEEALTSVDNFLVKAGSSFAKSYIEYACWLYFTGSRSLPDQFFPEAFAYPMLKPLNGVAQAEQDLEGLKMRLTNILVDSSLVYRAILESPVGHGVFNHLNNGQYTQGAHPFGSAQVFSQQKDHPLVLVMTNPDSEILSEIKYSLVKNPDTENLTVYTMQTEQGIKFFNVPFQAKISIYSLNGLPLQTLETGTSNTGGVDWDAKERNGRKLSTGVYLFFVKSDDQSYLGKFSFVQK